MRIITEQDVQHTLDMKSCIKLMSETLASLSSGDASQVLRNVIRLEDNNLMGIMPSVIRSRKVAGAKILSVFPDNYKSGLPSHQGGIMVFGTEKGELRAVVDAESITGIRTAAVSAVATEHLANKDAGTLALLGAGLQARKHLEAIMLVRHITEVRVWDICFETADKFATYMKERFEVNIIPCKSAEEAAYCADIICTLTPSKTPVLEYDYVKKGSHINAVGACSPKARELDSKLVKESLFYVDCKESAVNESGDYLIPLGEGLITEEHILGELGDLILGRLKARTNAEDITVFEALGLGVEDLAAADYVLKYI